MAMAASIDTNSGQAGTREPRSRIKFDQKRDRILDAATTIMNQQGAKGTTLLEVAQAVGLNTTSVTYYFRRKELLVAAVFERTLDRLHALVREAGSENTPRARIRRFITLHVELRAGVIRGTLRPLASLSEMRTLEDPLRLPLEKTYQSVFRDVRALLQTPSGSVEKDVLTARAHIVLENMFWLPVWLSHYPLDEFGRIADRLFHILENGLAPPNAPWEPLALLPGDAPDEDSTGREGSASNFLKVATRLINEIGYRGASVGRIVEELKLTKGSFYHHLDAKDDLVLECFRHSYRRIAQVQALARTTTTDEWQRLSSTIATLLNIQFAGQWPLTRASALRAMPRNLRMEAVERSDRTAMRFAGGLIEGAAQASLRLVDPMVASQVIIATLNSAFDLRTWASRLGVRGATRIYASTLRSGLFDESVKLDCRMIEPITPSVARQRPSTA